MAVKTFAVGELVTASDANTYLANAGLVFVKQVTVGTAVSSVTVSDAFSATYDDYRVVFSGIDCSVGGFSWSIQFGTATSNYYGSSYYDLYSGTSGTLRTNAGAGVYVGVQDVDNTSASLDVFRPYLSTITPFHGTFYGGGYSGWAGGSHAAIASHTSIKMNLGSGTMTGGTITVFGYRKA